MKEDLDVQQSTQPRDAEHTADFEAFDSRANGEQQRAGDGALQKVLVAVNEEAVGIDGADVPGRLDADADDAPRLRDRGLDVEPARGFVSDEASVVLRRRREARVADPLGRRGPRLTDGHAAPRGLRGESFVAQAGSRQHTSAPGPGYAGAPHEEASMDRRTFLAATAAAAVHAARPLVGFTATAELGSIDGSVGGNNFTAGAVPRLPQLDQAHVGDDLAAGRRCSDDEAAVRAIRGTPIGSASSCSSRTARSARAHARSTRSTARSKSRSARALKASQIFGATCMRCVLGGDPERPQIEMHIDNMIKAVRGIRSRIVDSGVKLAVENHGGDLQAREMKMMVEAVGTDVMGVCLDSGNPVWMLEDPHMTLEMLIPYAETCHVRDSAVWKMPEGIAVRWVNMGDGNVDIDGWIRKFIAAKPGLPIIFENLVSGNPRVHAIYDPKFWDNWREDAGVGVQPVPADRRTRACRSRPMPLPAGKTAGQQRIEDLEICVRYTRELLNRI